MIGPAYVIGVLSTALLLIAVEGEYGRLGDVSGMWAGAVVICSLIWPAFWIACLVYGWATR